jgi:hypothetical protein
MESQTIAETIAQLSPPRCHGDQLALALLEHHARRIAELDAQIDRTPMHTTRRYMLERDRSCQQQIAEAIGRVALAYRVEPCQ